MLEIVVSQREIDLFKKALRADKMRLCVSNRYFVHYLSNAETNCFKALELAFCLLPVCTSTMDLVRHIRDKIPMYENYSQAKGLADLVTYAYGDVLKQNKRLDNLIYVQFQQALAEKAAALAERNRDPKVMEIASKIAQRAAEAGGYDRPTEQTEVSKIPQLIVVTSDTRVLKAQQQGDSADETVKYLADGTETQ
jgi:hypothetical protein